MLKILTKKCECKRVLLAHVSSICGPHTGAGPQIISQRQVSIEIERKCLEMYIAL